MTWTQARLKFVTRFGYGDALPPEETQAGDFEVFGSNGPYASFSRSNTLVPVIIIGRKGSYGKINWSSKNCFASDTTFFVDASTTKQNLRWIFWLLQSLRLDEGSDEAAVPGLNRENAYEQNVFVPSIPEQRAIANYLDRKTARLDALVAAKERWLELLAEKRRALITQAVTRGVLGVHASACSPEPAKAGTPNAAAPLRDSGIAWLGKVPKHWRIVPLKFLSSLRGGATPDKGNAEYWSGDIPWVSPKDMKRDEISDAEDHISESALADSPLQLIPAPAVLVVVRGMILAHSFPTAVTVCPVTINQDMKAIVCGSVLLPRFLQRFLQGFASLLVASADSSAHGTRKIESEVLEKFSIALPPLAEQRAIIAHIAAEMAKIDALSQATQRTIDLLKERRAALIAAAVTGKITVPTRPASVKNGASYEN